MINIPSSTQIAILLYDILGEQPVPRQPVRGLGEEVLNKFSEELSEIATLEKKPLLEGKNMFIILAPNK